MDTELNDTQKVTLLAMRTDEHGNPTPFSEVPVWTSSDEGVATVQAAEDGLSAVVSSVSLGSADIQVSGNSLTKTWNVGVTGAQILVMAMPPQPK